MDPVELRTPRLLLRPFRPEDAPAVTAACQDPDIARFTTVPSPYTRQDGQGYVESWCPEQWRTGAGAPYAVVDAGSGELLASVGLSGIGGGAAELGYWCAPAARGRGVVAEAAAAVCRWGFDALGLGRVTWYAEVGNWASRRVADTVGFRVEGTLRSALVHRGERVDAWVAGLLPGDEPEPDRRLPLVELVGPTVRLRLLEPTDMADQIAGVDDPAIRHWLRRIPNPYGETEARQWLEREVPEARWTGRSLHLAVLPVSGEGLLGALSVMDVDRDEAKAELGCWVAAPARGRGVMTEAVTLVADWALSPDGLGLQRLEWLAAAGNRASQRVAEKAGFAYEGRWRRCERLGDGTLVDLIGYGRLA